MKWYSYIICVVIIVLGAFIGVRFYQVASASSYVNGSIDISNKFSQTSFFYSNSSVTLYPIENAEAWTYEVDLVKTENFDGENKEYRVELNDYVLVDTTITVGAVKSNVRMDFYNTDGTLACEGAMTVTIRFLTGKTQLTLSCQDELSARYFETYFTDNGIRLAVIEVL